MPDTNQHQRAYELAEDRKNGPPQNQAAAIGDEPETSAKGGSGKVASSQWIMMFIAVSIFWLAGLATNFLLPAIINIIMNYLIVLWLWVWQKPKGLPPPPFATATKGAAGVALRAAGPEGQAVAAEAAAADQVPGSDVLYIGLGGITPMFYLSALWYNNR